MNIVITIIRCRYISRSIRNVITFYRQASRHTYDNWIRSILNIDGLNRRGLITTIICSCPDARQSIIVRAIAIGARFLERDINIGIAIIRCRYISRSRNSITLNICISRNTYEHWRIRIHHGDVLRLHHLITTVICSRPSSRDGRFRSAVARRNDFLKGNVYIIITIIRCRNVCSWCRNIITFSGHVFRHTHQDWISRILNRDDLCINRFVTAIVCSRPYSGQSIVVDTSTVRSAFTIANRHIDIAVIRCRWASSLWHIVTLNGKITRYTRKDWCSRIFNIDFLNRCRLITTVICRCPDSRDGVILRTVACRCCFLEGNVYIIVAVIRCRYIVRWSRNCITSDCFISRNTEDFRCCSIFYKDGLACYRFITTIVKGSPSTCDGVTLLARTILDRFVECNLNIIITVVRCRWCCRIRNVITFYRYIRRDTRQYWIGCILYGDGLRTYILVTTIIRCCPSTDNRVVVCTIAIRCCFREGHFHIIITIICRNYIVSSIRNCITLNSDIFWHTSQYRSRCILHRNDLCFHTFITTIIRCSPSSC